MSYESKLESVKSLVDEFNSHISNPTDRVNFEGFKVSLIHSGGVIDAALMDCSWEDLQSMGLPKLLARQVAKIFRGSEETKQPKFISANRAQGMSPVELLTVYDPRDTTNAVGKRLMELSKSQRCIVFNNEGAVDVEASTILIGEIRDGFPERAVYLGSAGPQKIYRVGDRPEQLADENPLYPGRMLRPDGTCDQLNRSWAGVSYEIRALIYLAIANEIRINCLDDAHRVLDLAIQSGAEEQLRSRYPQAAIRFLELKEENDLPSLKIRLGASSDSSNNPFHRKY